ncbi:hypothetical protein DXG03_002385 [Asterophora parasitica]|uniref:Uncharacterized protein n=1 Tax=Asterophora parasitica TaxID=117018 RepID=A0A9P7KC96_9AGAR|nr:hypothetical protein DXG03_002385 [Asterophora parasitica]
MSSDGHGSTSSYSRSTTSGSASGWHSIRPWTPPLSLSVREITSVSITFTLSSTLSDPTGDLEPLAALGLIAGEEFSGDKGTEPEPVSDGESSQQALEPKKKLSVIADALAKGLSVDVNGASWQRVFIRIEDGADEAVIIIYGLMPGREYDVKLGLVQGESNGNASGVSTIRQQITTEEVELEPSEGSTDRDSLLDADHSISTSSDPSPSTTSTSPSHTHPNTPPTTTFTVSLTLEDRLAQLQHTLSIINTERETLAVALKSARRDAQKADAALRSEIDILKRASEKHAAADHRAKQKVLSLQEAVKRAQTATRETEALVAEVEALLPELNHGRQAKEAEHAQVKEKAERARKIRDGQVEAEKKRVEGMRGELMGLSHRMEKLGAKREKLESNAIKELEEQLKGVQREVEKAEQERAAQEEAWAYQAFISQQEAFIGLGQQEFSAEDIYHGVPDERSPAFPYLPVQRLRSQLSPGTIGRPPPPAPIQRPTPSEPTPGYGHLHRQPHSNQRKPAHAQPYPLPHTHGAQTPTQSTQPPWSHRPPTQGPSHNSRSSSLHHQTPTLLTNPHRQSSITASDSSSSSINPAPATNGSSVKAPPAASTPSPSKNTPASSTSNSTSTLSSRAPAFEPGRSRTISSGGSGATNTSTGIATGPMQRGSRGLSGFGHGHAGQQGQGKGKQGQGVGGGHSGAS